MSSPGSGMKADVHAIGQHEKEIRQVAGQVDQAADATSAGQAFGDFDAFGIVGQVIAVAISHWINEATDAVKSVSDTGHALADGLRDTRTDIDDTEQHNTQIMDDIDKERP
ncbi:MAG: hypothetical protein ACRDQA_08060 [Nocardioidaceae bacterium]